MVLSIVRWVKGYLRIRAEGYSPERFLNACRYRGIDLWGLKSAGGAYEMYISLEDFRKSATFLRKTGTRVKVRRRHGLPFFLYRFRKRKLFFAGAFLGVSLLYILSLFIWEIDIEWNRQRTDEAILSFLRTEDIYCGMASGDVDCRRISEELRRKFDDFVWVSAAVDGTKLIIRVKENEVGTEEKNVSGEERGTDLTAERDCRIVSIVTRKGTPSVRAGEEVKKGQVLVSGRMDLTDDAGEVTGYRYTQAQADITGEYRISYEDTQDRSVTVRDYIYDRGSQIRQKEYFLRIGTWTLTFGSVKNSYPDHEYHIEEKQLFHDSASAVPVFYGVREAVPCTLRKETRSDGQLRELLSARFQRACRDMKKKGLEIVENDVKIYTEQNAASAKGTVTVRGPVGTASDSQILPEPEAAGRTERED